MVAHPNLWPIPLTAGPLQRLAANSSAAASKHSHTCATQAFNLAAAVFRSSRTGLRADYLRICSGMDKGKAVTAGVHRPA